MIGGFRNFRKNRKTEPPQTFCQLFKKKWEISDFFQNLRKIAFSVAWNTPNLFSIHHTKKRDGEVLNFPRPVDIFESEHGAHGGSIPPDPTVLIKVIKYQALLGNQQINKKQ